uniref:integrase core domain-containing protein n=1 Tax=Komagataeibacter xylinus TaxID=28448 RepID=UPI0011DCE07A
MPSWNERMRDGWLDETLSTSPNHARQVLVDCCREDYNTVRPRDPCHPVNPSHKKPELSF